jgi:hypothetical protein
MLQIFPGKQSGKKKKTPSVTQVFASFIIVEEILKLSAHNKSFVS